MNPVTRPIRIFGLIIILLPFLSIGAIVAWLASRGFLVTVLTAGFYFPLALLLLSHILLLVTGIGVFGFRKWGYYLFKMFLYVLAFGFPVGTVVSYVTLAYVRKHHIETHFGMPEHPPGTGTMRAVRWGLGMLVVAGLVALWVWLMYFV